MEKKKIKPAISEKDIFNALMSSLEYGLTIQDRDYNILFQNDFMRNHFGSSSGKCYKVYEFRDAPCKGCPVRKAFRDGKSHDAERTVREPTGEIRIWLNTAIPIRNDEGRVGSCLEIVRDISPLKRMKESIIENEARLHTLLQTIPDLIWLKDENGVYLACNKMFERFFGAKEEDIVGKTDYDFVDRELADFFRGNDRSAMAAGKPRCNEEWITFADDGHRVLLDTIKTPMFDSEGNIIGVLGIGRDITERKQAEEKLKETLLFQKDTERIARVGGWKANQETDLLLWTEGVKRIIEVPLDYNPGFEEGLTFYLPEYIPKLKDAVSNSFKNGATFAIEAEVITAKGKRLWTEVRGLRRITEKEKNYLVGTFQDITERKQSEEEQKKLLNQLNQAQKMESVGRLAGGVAHDFNNMLSVIIGHAELALEQLNQDNPLFDSIKEILKAAGRSADITRQLLTFARKQVVIPRVLDLNETVAGMLNMLKRLIGEDIDIAWLPGSGVWPVKMDSSQIDQILANLCVNARDSIDGQGRIAIETGNVSFDEAHCAQHSDAKIGEFVMLAVSDNGHGMDKETQEKIFEPFFTTKAQGEGTGLGLAMIYGIAKQNNGCIEVYSELGNGTTFKIYFPRHTADTAEPHIKSLTTQELAQGNETILLVEDDPSILNMAKSSLERLGYQVLDVSTPGEAFQLAKKHVGRIHLLLTDVIMPEMNGRELAKALASIFPELKLLFMSGYTADVIAPHGVLDEGINFIQKPFSLQTLAVSVRKALDN